MQMRFDMKLEGMSIHALTGRSAKSDFVQDPGQLGRGVKQANQWSANDGRGGMSEPNSKSSRCFVTGP
jgi:hypothetical protein